MGGGAKVGDQVERHVWFFVEVVLKAFYIGPGVLVCKFSWLPNINVKTKVHLYFRFHVDLLVKQDKIR